MKNIRIFYDYFMVRGGAEKVTLDLLDLPGNPDCYVHFIDKEFPLSAAKKRQIKTLSHSAVLWRLLPRACTQLLTPLAFLLNSKRVAASEKVLFFTGIFSILASRKSSKTTQIYYCHTPPRHWYDLEDYYHESQSILIRILISFQKFLFKGRYERAIDNMDIVLANSENVQRRLNEYLSVKSRVLYPPTNTADYAWKPAQGYYLSTARLEPYKRVRIVVEAFKSMPDKQLIIASGGSEENELRRIATGFTNIKFTGWCSQGDLKNLIEDSIATIYVPIDEDFGLSPVESMAAGKPVIGVAEGGVQETVIDRETGYLCPANPKAEDIEAGVCWLDGERATQLRKACEERANSFSMNNFRTQVLDLLRDC